MDWGIDNFSPIWLRLNKTVAQARSLGGTIDQKNGYQTILLAEILGNIISFFKNSVR